MIRARGPEAASPGGASLELDLLGSRVRIEAEDEALPADLAKCFETTPPGHPVDRRGFCLRVLVRSRTSEGEDDDRLSLTSEPPRALEIQVLPRRNGAQVLASALTQWAVANAATHYVFHAGAVARAGRAVLLPGKPYSGKSTLAAGLVLRGFELLSDEVGAVDVSSGRLAGYPRALFIRQDVLAALGVEDGADPAEGPELSRPIAVRELNGTRARGGASPVLIVVPCFERGAPTRFDRLRPGAVVLALMEASCSQRRFKAVGLDLVVELARRTPAFRLTFSDLASALDTIEGAMPAASAVPP